MSISLMVTTNGGLPVYKQLLKQFESKIKSGNLKPGDVVPSMNELSEELGISKETVKKVYSILRDRGLLESHQGKGFYVKSPDGSQKISILILFDKMSIYKQTILNTFMEGMEDRVNTTILLHNQNLDLYEYYLDMYLDQFDYYIVTPHFPLDAQSRKRMMRLTSRIPNRKLIVLDHLPEGMKGNFGAVYQDYENDAYKGLQEGLSKLKQSGKLNVIILNSSLYGNLIYKAVKRFCGENGIESTRWIEPPRKINRNDAFLVIGSQLDTGVADLAENVENQGFVVGKDVFIISYNEFPLNKVVLGGLTTISTDFSKMGYYAARMIKEKRMFKQICDFGMIRRHTF